MEMLVKLQSMIKGYLQRVKFKALKHQYNIKKAKYFTSAEGKETVGTLPYSKFVATHASFRYQSGATYEGEWLGGLRHGTGVMTWSEGT